MKLLTIDDISEMLKLSRTYTLNVIVKKDKAAVSYGDRWVICLRPFCVKPSTNATKRDSAEFCDSAGVG